MAKDLSKELKQLKKDYYDLEEKGQEEKEALIRVINTFGLIASTQKDVAEDIKGMKELLNTEDELHLDSINDGIQKIKSKIIEKEREAELVTENEDPFQLMTDKLFESCRTIKKITTSILEDLYPMTDNMKAMADKIQIDCKGDLTSLDLKEPTDNIIGYIAKLKTKISEDFRFISETFITFLEHVKELEKISLEIEE